LAWRARRLLAYPAALAQRAREMTTPEPIATGTLAKTPFPHLLVYLDQKKLSGTLAL
jgi:hypothetical protein